MQTSLGVATRCGALIVLGLATTLACAQIRTDGSLGPAAQNLAGPNYLIGETLGRLSGNNLFHSFQTFKVGAGGTATFTTQTPAIANVISRVTGGEVSTINGALKLQAAAGSPAFYFINPAGVTFGEGASIDVPAAFHVSTANSLRFADGSFHADLSQASSLSAAAPEAFGFLGSSRATIALAGATLTTPGSVSLIAGDVAIDGGDAGHGIANTLGDIRLVAVGDRPVNVSLREAAGIVNGRIRIDGGAVVETLAENAAGGSIALAAGEIVIEQAQVLTRTIGAGRAGDMALQTGSLQVTALADVGSKSEPGSRGNVGNVTVNASGNVLVDDSYFRSDTKGDGAGGSLQLNAASLTLSNDAWVSSDTLGSGAGGTVQVVVGGLITITDDSWISADAYADGHGGAVNVSSGSLRINGGKGRAGISSDADIFGDWGLGNGGTVTVVVKGDADLRSQGRISTNAFGPGNAGQVSVSARNLLIDGEDYDRTGIFSNAYEDSTGNAGAVNVQVTEQLVVTHAGRIATTAKGVGSGSAGAVEVSAGSLLIDGSSDYDTGIMSRAVSDLGGDSGSVSLTVRDTVRLLNDGSISTSTWAGNAGEIKIRAAALDISNHSGVFSDAKQISSGNAGTVDIQIAGPVAVSGGSYISSDTGSIGNAGSVRVNARSVAIDGQGNSVTGITSDALSNERDSGHAGNVDVTVSDELSIKNGGRISSRTDDQGSAGSVQVSAGSLLLAGRGDEQEPSSIDALASRESGGQTGSVSVAIAGNALLVDGGEISIRNDATAADPAVMVPTVLQVNAARLSLTDSAITAASSGNVAASNIFVRVSDRLTLDPSLISTSANLGNGGSITIDGGRLMWLDNSSITTSVAGLKGDGGDIVLNGHVLVLNSGFIQANTAAAKATGGDIRIALDALLPSHANLRVGGNEAFAFAPFLRGFNVIQAAAPTGISGTIAIASPELDLAGSLVGLNAQVAQPVNLGRSPCQTNAGSSLSVAGRGGLPARLDGAACKWPAQEAK